MGRQIKRYIFLILTLLGVMLLPVSAQAYDYYAAHPDAAQQLSSAELEKGKKKVWDFLRKRGWCEELCAGAMGNFYGESSYNWTLIEGGKSWDWTWVRWVPPEGHTDPGRHGFGLCQWTYSTRQDGLLKVCDEAGKQWTDLDCQLKWLGMELDGGYEQSMARKAGYSSVEDFKTKLKDVEKATSVFCQVFEGPSIPHNSSRIAAAKEAYSKYSGSSISSTFGDSSSAQAAKIEKYIMVGDSRTDALKGIVDSDWVLSCKVGEGYDWMKSHGVPDIESQISSNTALIFWMGVNDGANQGQAEKYAEYVNGKASEWVSKGASIYYVSVGPIDADPYITNEQIESFNSTLKSKLSSSVSFIDIYSDIKSMGSKLTADGIHYKSDINKKIYDLIKSKVDSVFASNHPANGDVSLSSRMIVNEWDLLGMAQFKPKILDSATAITLPTVGDLSISEVYSVQKVKENVELTRQAKKITTVRVLVVFIGLILVMYSILLLVSLFFDKANSWFDFSLVRILSFGRITYTNEYGGDKIKGYSSEGRIVVVCVVILCVGLFLISGGLFEFMYRAVVAVGDLLSRVGVII